VFFACSLLDSDGLQAGEKQGAGIFTIPYSNHYSLVGVSRLVCRDFHFPKSKGAPTTTVEHLLKLFVGAPWQTKVETLFYLTGKHQQGRKPGNVLVKPGGVIYTLSIFMCCLVCITRFRINQFQDGRDH